MNSRLYRQIPPARNTCGCGFAAINSRRKATPV
jgi:hypothetical protein